MIVFSMSIFVPSSQHADLARTLSALLEPVRVAPGCLRCQLYTDFDDPNGFMLVEEWDSQAMLDRHLRSDACKTLLAAIELSTQPPVIRFDHVAQRAGIEVMERARRPTNSPEIHR